MFCLFLKFLKPLFNTSQWIYPTHRKLFLQCKKYNFYYFYWSHLKTSLFRYIKQLFSQNSTLTPLNTSGYFLEFSDFCIYVSFSMSQNLLLNIELFLYIDKRVSYSRTSFHYAPFINNILQCCLSPDMCWSNQQYFFVFTLSVKVLCTPVKHLTFPAK